jgi:SAM-dependent methyltransferase
MPIDPSVSVVSQDPTQRFSDRVADYERYRPGYPSALIDHLREQGALPRDAVVADVGSGTGISAALFLDAGYEVMAAEPNAEMRAAAERRLGGAARFHSIAARAEATTLPHASIDLVAAGTAFHWFDRDATRLEFARILKPSGHVALFWNVRSLDSEFMRDYEALLRAHCIEYGATNARERADENAIRAFFGAGYISKTKFANAQALDFDGLLGRLLSSSYAPREGQPAYEPMVPALRGLFDRCAENGRVAMLYDTQLHLGRLDS